MGQEETCLTPRYRSQLNEDDAREILGRLIDHYVLLVNAGEQPLVVRKLASSLATIFLSPGVPWARALLNLAASLANGKYITEEQCQSLDLETAVLPVMSETQVVSLLYFSNILAEELDKSSAEARPNEDNHRVNQNVGDAFSLVEVVLRHILQQEASGVPVSDAAAGTEAIQSYQASRPAPSCYPLWTDLCSHGCRCEGLFSCAMLYHRPN